MSAVAGPRAAGAVAVVAVAAGLSPVVEDLSWLRDVVLAVVVVAVLGAALARTRLPAAAAVGVQLAGLLVLLCVLYAPAQAVLGLLPGPAAWGRGADLVADGAAVVRREAAPVPGVPGLRLLITAGAGLLAVLVDAVAVRGRRPALAGLPLLGVHCTALVFAPGGLGWGWFALAAAGYLLLLGADAPERVARWGRRVNRAPREGAGGASVWGSWSAAGRTAAVASVALAVLTPVLVPGLSAGADLRGSGEGDGSGGGVLDSVDPLFDLRSDLEARSDAVVLTYRTGVEAPPPLRIVTVDTFDGNTWRPTPPDDLEASGLDPLPAAPGLDDSTPSELARYAVTVGALRQQWLPLPYPAVSVDVEGDWLVDPATLNVSGEDGERTRSGQQYTAEFLQVEPTSQQLASAPAAPEDVVAAYGTVPEDLPEEIEATAREVTADAQDPYGRAVALQEFFRSDGGFTYSLDAPEPRSASALADFLEDRSGYCTHFASAMAVMARTLGIPARVAIGFLPGRESGESWRIALQDAHAWPELYFAGAGWVRFEPTPGGRTGAAPDWTVPASASSPSTAVPAAPAPSAAAPVAPSQRPDAGESPQAQAEAEGASLPWQAPVVLALVLGLAAAPLVSRSVVSRRRWSRASGAQQAEAAWLDLVEQLGDLGVGVPVSATPRQVGRSLVPDAPAEAVGRLVTAVEGSRYGGGPAVEGAQALTTDVRTVVAAMAATRPRSASWRWRWWPTSGVAHLARWGAALRGATSWSGLRRR